MPRRRDVVDRTQPSGWHEPPGAWTPKFDNRILAVAHYLNRRQEGGTVLVTKDLNLRIKADVLGIQAEDFQSDRVDYQQLYNGVEERHLSAEELDRLYREGRVQVSETEPRGPIIFSSS